MPGRARQFAALLLTLIPLAAWAQAPSPGGNTPADATGAMPTFEQLLAESGMMFEVPEGLESAEIRPNRLFPYDKALASPILCERANAGRLG